MAAVKKVKKVEEKVIKAELILKYWEGGIQERYNYRELELDIGEMDMGLEWAKKLDELGWMPKLYSRTWDGIFTVYYGDEFIKEKPKKVSKPRSKKSAA